MPATNTTPRTTQPIRSRSRGQSIGNRSERTERDEHYGDVREQRMGWKAEDRRHGGGTYGSPLNTR
jgi:hypothetical protein